MGEISRARLRQVPPVTAAGYAGTRRGSCCETWMNRSGNTVNMTRLLVGDGSFFMTPGIMVGVFTLTFL